MPLPKDEAWFPAKRYGWGWGFPCRWQGWAVFLGFILAMAAGSPLLAIGPIHYMVYSIALAGVMIGICWWKGEKPGWSWGRRD